MVILLKTIDQWQFEAKNNGFGDLQWFFTWLLFETWLPWQQGMVYTYHFDFKILPLHVRESEKASEENLLPFHRYLAQTTKEGEKHPGLEAKSIHIKSPTTGIEHI